MKNRAIDYKLTRETTRRQTGFFVVTPAEDTALEDVLGLLKARPMDDFLHQHIVTRIASMPPDALRLLLEQTGTPDDPVYRALAAEHLLLTNKHDFPGEFPTEVVNELIHHTPLIYLRSFLEPGQALHRQWTAFFRPNLLAHKPLVSPEKTGILPLPVEKNAGAAVTLPDLANSTTGNRSTPSPSPPPDRTATTATERLEKAGVELGQLMRHQASLSPIGLLRSWRLSRRIDHHRNRFTLSGEQTGFGRGLSLDAARASLMMEIVERCSAFAGVSPDGLTGFQNDYPLLQAPFSRIDRGKITHTGTGPAAAINPATLALEVAYRDQVLHWVQGETPDRRDNQDSSRPIWVPAQCLFLFCNLDEPSLFSGLGSTGLAAGDTLARAKVSALLEIIERHQAATVPFDRSSCFQLLARDRQVAQLLETYYQAGVDLWFQDITPAMGVPCCRCFVVEQAGTIHTGSAAHLDARRAIVSAITETTCPFPNPPPIKPAPDGLARVGYENLPDYSTGDDLTDLRLLETLLMGNSYQPCYVDLTRKDIGLPVVRAIVPGMELLGDFDDYSRVHPELYRNYLGLFNTNL